MCQVGCQSQTGVTFQGNVPALTRACSEQLRAQGGQGPRVEPFCILCPPLLQTSFMIWTFFYRPAWCHLPEPSAPQGLSQTSLCSIKNIPECLRWARPCGGVWPSPAPPAQQIQDDDDDVPRDKSSSEHAQEQSPTNFSIPTFCDCHRGKKFHQEKFRRSLCCQPWLSPPVLLQPSKPR